MIIRNGRAALALFLATLASGCTLPMLFLPSDQPLRLTGDGVTASGQDREYLKLNSDKAVARLKETKALLASMSAPSTYTGPAAAIVNEHNRLSAVVKVETFQNADGTQRLRVTNGLTEYSSEKDQFVYVVTLNKTESGSYEPTYNTFKKEESWEISKAQASGKYPYLIMTPEFYDEVGRLLVLSPDNSSLDEALVDINTNGGTSSNSREIWMHEPDDLTGLYFHNPREDDPQFCAKHKHNHIAQAIYQLENIIDNAVFALSLSPEGRAKRDLLHAPIRDVENFLPEYSRLDKEADIDASIARVEQLKQAFLNVAKQFKTDYYDPAKDPMLAFKFKDSPARCAVNVGSNSPLPSVSLAPGLGVGGSPSSGDDEEKCNLTTTSVTSLVQSEDHIWSYTTQVGNGKIVFGGTHTQQYPDESIVFTGGSSTDLEDVIRVSYSDALDYSGQPGVIWETKGNDVKWHNTASSKKFKPGSGLANSESMPFPNAADARKFYEELTCITGVSDK